MVIPAGSKEYVHVTATATPAGTVLTGTLPRFAFLPASNRSNPGVSDWLTGEWDGASVARILVGPGGAITLTPGDWHVWINIDPPSVENVIRKAGYLSAT